MSIISEKVRISMEVRGEGVTTQLNKFQKGWNKVRHQISGFNQVMGMNQDTFKKVGNNIDEFGSRGARFAGRMRNATHGLRGFKMEMLGVMFFGMAMQRMFSGLLKPALQTVGVFELWRTTLQVLFLPLSILLLNFLMPLFTWLMNLDESTKLFIGKLVLLGLAIGTILFVVGTLALGIGALIMAFSGIFNVIDKLIPNFTVAGVEMSSFVEAGLGITLVTGAFDLLRGVFGNLMNRFMKIPLVQDLFNRLGISIDSNKTPLENLRDAFGAVIDKIKEKLGLGDGGDGEGFFEKTFQKIQDKIKETQEEVKEKLQDLGITGPGGAIETFKELGQILSDITPDIQTIAGAISGVANAIKKVQAAFGGATLSEIQAAPSIGRFTPANFSTSPAVNYSPTFNIATKSDRDIAELITRENQLWLDKIMRNLG